MAAGSTSQESHGRRSPWCRLPWAAVLPGEGVGQALASSLWYRRRCRGIGAGLGRAGGAGRPPHLLAGTARAWRKLAVPSSQPRRHKSGSQFAPRGHRAWALKTEAASPFARWRHGCHYALVIVQEARKMLEALCGLRQGGVFYRRQAGAPGFMGAHGLSGMGMPFPAFPASCHWQCTETCKRRRYKSCNS